MTFNCEILIILQLCCYKIQLIYDNTIHHSLLEVLEIHHIPINYQCRSGYCGSCRAFLIQGTIQYRYKYPLGCIRPGEILTCCSIPTKKRIILQL